MNNNKDPHEDWNSTDIKVTLILTLIVIIPSAAFLALLYMRS